MDDDTLVVVLPRSTGDGVRCARCQHACEVDGETAPLVLGGVSPLCHPCSVEIALRFPSAMRRVTGAG